MDLTDFGIRDIRRPQQGPAFTQAVPPDPYGLSMAGRQAPPVLPPVQIGPLSAPLRPVAPAYAAPFAMPRQPAARPVAAPAANVVPFRMGQPTAPQTSPRTDTAQAAPANIPLDRLVNIQRDAESRGQKSRYTATNPETSASGAYQYTDGTWNNYGGYKRAMYAPPEVQDRRFAEDVAKRVHQYNGDAFKALAAHYLPALANDPRTWFEGRKFQSKGKTITAMPVATYLRKALRGTQYEKQLDDYLASYK